MMNLKRVAQELAKEYPNGIYMRDLFRESEKNNVNAIDVLQEMQNIVVDEKE